MQKITCVQVKKKGRQPKKQMLKLPNEESTSTCPSILTTQKLLSSNVCGTSTWPIQMVRIHSTNVLTMQVQKSQWIIWLWPITGHLTLAISCLIGRLHTEKGLKLHLIFDRIRSGRPFYFSGEQTQQAGLAYARKIIFCFNFSKLKSFYVESVKSMAILAEPFMCIGEVKISEELKYLGLNLPPRSQMHYLWTSNPLTNYWRRQKAETNLLV